MHEVHIDYSQSVAQATNKYFENLRIHSEDVQLGVMRRMGDLWVQYYQEYGGNIPEGTRKVSLLESFCSVHGVNDPSEIMLWIVNCDAVPQGVKRPLLLLVLNLGLAKQSSLQEIHSEFGGEDEVGGFSVESRHRQELMTTTKAALLARAIPPIPHNV